MLPELHTLLAASAVVFAAYFVFGITAFGSGLVAIPFLTHLWPLSFVLPIMVMLDCFNAGTVAWRQRQYVAWRELCLLIPIMVVGLVGGVTLLINLPPRSSMAGLGMTVMVFGGWALLGADSQRVVHRAWVLPAGLLSGVASGVFGVGGPPVALYLTGRLRDKPQLRASLATSLMLSVAVRIVLFLIAGLLSLDIVATMLVLLPFALAGLYLGSKVHTRLSREHLARFVAVLVMCSGISLVVRAFVG